MLGDRVLVMLPPRETVQDEAGYTFQAQEQKTASGLILAKPADAYNVETATRGIVVQLGLKKHTVDLDAVLDAVKNLHGEELVRTIKRLGPAPFDVQEGDMVIFAPESGQLFVHEGTEYVMLREDDLLGVVEPRDTATSEAA